MPNSNSHDSSSRAAVAAPLTPSSSPTSARRQQIKRAITELSPPGKNNLHLLRSEAAHRPQDHRFRPHNHHSQRKNVSQDVRRPHAEDTKPLVRHSIDMGRSSIAQQGLIPSPTPSRRASILIQNEMDNKFGPTIQEARLSKEERLREAQKKANYRADGLKESLAGLHNFAADATKRLDDTYYSVLEKMDALQNTITALKDLAESSHDIYGTFEKESRDLEHEIVSQIGSLGRFENQQSKIDSLQSRIKGGRARIGMLSERVDVVRQRVEGWEEADREWQEKTRKKMKLIWSTTMVLVLTLVLLFLGLRGSLSESTLPQDPAAAISSATQRLSRPPNTSKPLTPLDFKGKLGSGPAGEAKDDIAGIQETLDGRRRAVDRGGLRALDEL